MASDILGGLIESVNCAISGPPRTGDTQVAIEPSRHTEPDKRRRAAG